MSPIPLVNYLDVEGFPVCPTCGRAILPVQGVMRIADCMIHVACCVTASIPFTNDGRGTPPAWAQICFSLGTMKTTDMAQSETAGTRKALALR